MKVTCKGVEELFGTLIILCVEMSLECLFEKKVAAK